MFQNIIEALFFRDKEKNYPWLKVVWFVGLYVVGVYFWDKFTSWKIITLDFIDWGYLITPRLTFLQNAYNAAELPLHMAGTPPLLGLTDRYFVIPDTISTPQTLLLLFFSIPTFIMIDIVIHYSIGFLGLLWIRRKFNLSLFVFAVLFFVFRFNGHILAHYTVGHLNWNAYFLFPFVFMYLFQFLDGVQGWRWVTGFSFIMFYILLAGGEHHFLWILIFLGVLILFSYRRAFWLIMAGLFSGLLGAVRLLPPAFNYQVFTDTRTFEMALGYPSFAEFFESMIFVRRPNYVKEAYLQYNLKGYLDFYPEFNFYLGVIGTLFIVIFGFYFWFRQQSPEYRKMIVPAFVLIALSIGSTYWILRLTAIPIFGGERISSRMIVVPTVLFMIMAAHLLQAWLNQKRIVLWHQIISLCLLSILIIDLFNNLRVWRMSETAQYFGSVQIDFSSSLVANHPDPAYTISLLIGLALTIASSLALGILSLRERRTESKQ